MTRNIPRRRPGFTLIELIVVMSIIAIIASLIVSVAYTASNKQLVGTGATNVVGWMKTAQAYALRDQKPYGVRLNVSGGNLITGAQYIEQPQEWVGPPGSTIGVTTPGNPFTLTGSAGVDFSGGFSAVYPVPPVSNYQYWAIQPLDYLECQSGQMAPIINVTPTTLTCTMMGGDTASMWAFPSCSTWRIVRQPRVMVGSEPLSLPTGVAINVTTNGAAPWYNSPLPAPVNGNIDILFSPTGAVITPGLPGRDIKLWLIDTTRPPTGNQTFTGDQLIVTIAIRTGLVSIQSVDVTLDPMAIPPGSRYLHPYAFTQDGRSSGF